jgi:hypothetical protein
MWNLVHEKLAPLTTRDGRYLLREDCEPQPTFPADHPTTLGIYGFLPGDGVDLETMRRTLEQLAKHWPWERAAAWDMPMAAMCAARLGQPELAVRLLLTDAPRNRFSLAGHCLPSEDQPCDLAVNGALLAAVGMMAAGWKGAPHTHAPGFPSDGTWRVRWEGLKPWL